MKADLKFLHADDWTIVLLNDKLLFEGHTIGAATLAHRLVGYDLTKVEEFQLEGGGELWASWVDIKDWRKLVIR